MMVLGPILESLLAPSLLQLPGICPAVSGGARGCPVQSGAAPGNGVRDAVRGPFSRAVAKITEVKQTPSNESRITLNHCCLDRIPSLSDP